MISGVYADGSLEAARIARIAEADGAACLLVFLPQSMAMGGQLRPEMAAAHFQALAALLGRLPPAVVRPPLVKLPDHEIEPLGRAIAAAGLEPEPARALAAE